MKIKEIEKRLNKASKGPWQVAKGGDKVYHPDVLIDNKPYFTNAEDVCILDYEKKEIICSSEWMRVKQEDLKFMAHARQDIEDLLNEIYKLKAKAKSKNIKQ